MEFSISTFVNDCFTILLQTRIWMYQTPKGYHKEALSDFFYSFNLVFDSFVSTYISKFGQFELEEEDTAIEIINFGETEASDWIYEFLNYLSLHVQDLEDAEEKNLVTIINEMKTTFGKLNYKLLLEKRNN